MKINQVDTYKYEISHFGKLVEHAEGKAGACFDNVIDYCEKYKELGQNTGVSLVLGLRTFDDDKCIMCYHYLVKNNNTGEFSDPQYWRYTFVELHNWSLDEYKREIEEFENEKGFRQSSEFFQWYCENNNKALKSVIKLIKDLADGKVKLTSQAIRDYFELGYINFKPTYGKKMFSLLNVG